MYETWISIGLFAPEVAILLPRARFPLPPSPHSLAHCQNESIADDSGVTMAWFEDNAPCDYFGSEWTSFLRAVGWLESEKPFSIGPLNKPVYEKLQQFKAQRVLDQWGWLGMLMHKGWYPCDFCPGEKPAAGFINFVIPGNGIIFIAPELILHYMAAHSYQPPAEFSQAVLDCPPILSKAYCDAFAANGGGRIIDLYNLRYGE